MNIKSVLVSLGLGLGAVALAYIFPIGLIIMPALLAFAGTVWGYGGLAIAAITAAGGIICIAGTVDSSIVGALVMFIPAGIAMTYIFINKLPYRSAAVIGAFFAALGIYIMSRRLLLDIIRRADEHDHYSFEKYSATRWKRPRHRWA